MHRSNNASLKKFTKEWLKAHEIEWLFPPTPLPYQSDEYLEYFHRTYGPMFMNRCPAHYDWKLLERYKDNIAFTNHMMGDNIVIPYTMLQFGPQFHVAADWLWHEHEERFLVSLNVFYKNNADYTKLLRDTADLQFFEQESGMGFQNAGFGGSHHHDSGVKTP